MNIELKFIRFPDACVRFFGAINRDLKQLYFLDEISKK